MSEKKLYLVDGHALIYRAYYALAKNPLTSSGGVPTGAIYGFINYLIKLIDTYSCPYMAVVMDCSVPTFRHKMYEQYKANRQAMPDDLRAQIPLIQEIVSAFNIPLVKKDGFEADDLIASLSCKARDCGYEVFIVSKDKDLMQLIGPQISMLAPEGTGVFQVFETKDVIEKMGIGPEKVVDYLGLIGDSSDNVPGVPGIGPKTALKILECCGSVDNLIKDPSILGNAKLIEKITENLEVLKISKELVTLNCDACLTCDIDTLLRPEPDRERCLSFFREYDLHLFSKNPLFGQPDVSAVVNVANVVNDPQIIKEYAEKIRKDKCMHFYLLTTQTVPRAAEITGVSIAVGDNESVFFTVDNSPETDNKYASAELDALKQVFEDESVVKIGHDVKTSYEVLKNYGILLKGISFDTMIAAYILEPGKRAFELSDLIPQWLERGYSVPENIQKALKDDSLRTVSTQSLAAYSGEIACAIRSLKPKLEIEVDRNGMTDLFRNIELPLVKVLAELEWYGMLIDTKLLKTMSDEYTLKLNGISDEVYSLAGESFNLNSPKQVGEVLFDRLKLPAAKKTKSGTYSTSVDILENLAEKFPVVQKILDYREIQKLLSTYIDALPSEILSCSGRVHSSFNQTVTATGRLSSTNPNLQNIPVRTDAGKKIREAFIAKPGSLLVSADYSQIELRILAHLSKDPFLVQAFMDDKDIHTQTASAIFGTFPEMVTSEMRRAAKTINFGLMYGMGPMNLARQLGISFGEAKSFIDTYFAQFPTIQKFMNSTIESARERGFTETLFGRRRYHPEINVQNRTIREAAERMAINTPVQGTAADIMKMAMILVFEKMNEVSADARMLMQVHDELVFEVPQHDAEKFRDWVVMEMSNACRLDVPLKVDGGIGENWSVAH